MIAFAIGVMLYIWILVHSEKLNELNDEETITESCSGNIRRAILHPAGRKFLRASAIIEFCSMLMFGLIAGPSVLWIKSFLTVAFVSFTMRDISVRLAHKIERREHKERESQLTIEPDKTQEI